MRLVMAQLLSLTSSDTRLLIYIFYVVGDCDLTSAANAHSSDIIIRTHKHRPTNKREHLFRSNHSPRAPLIQC